MWGGRTQGSWGCRRFVAGTEACVVGVLIGKEGWFGNNGGAKSHKHMALYLFVMLVASSIH